MASNGLQDYADFSLPIPPNRYIDDPEYFCRFHPRVHKETQASDDATVQCQIDVFGRANVGFVKGCLSLRSGGWTSLTYPYCLPERLALVSYINEPDTKCCDSSVSVGGRKKAVDPGWQNRHTQVFAKIAIQLVDTDSQLGNLVIQGLQTWKRGEAMMEEEIRYQNLTQYLSDRLVDNAFDLTKEEEKLIEPVLKPYYEIMILTNDYFSWETEYTTFLRSNEKVVVRNAVPLFMEWYSMSCQEAKVALKEKIKSLEDDYCSLKAGLFSQYQIPGSSPAVMRWFEILEGVLAGNIFWSKTCPRYNTAFGSEYKQYLAQRINEGAYFFNSSTESSAIISNDILKISKLNLSGQGVTDSEGGMDSMDDVQDHSPLRRGHPAAHRVYGIGQTVNSAYFQCADALRQIQKISSDSVLVFTGNVVLSYCRDTLH
ncbi:hypothetical protein IG631_19070 [Alternaria alternata]|nr:hypothetical protein IG631_19070 [Alternaria alternata]